MIFSVWSPSEEDTGEQTLVAGDEQPTFANGELDPNAAYMMYSIWADDWEQAMETHGQKLEQEDE